MSVRTSPIAPRHIAGPTLLGLALFLSGCGGSSNPMNNSGPPPASNTPFWSQWGSGPQHDGMVTDLETVRLLGFPSSRPLVEPVRNVGLVRIANCRGCSG